jgi:hypothetical protein
MIDLDIFDEFDNAIQKVDREIINLKLKKKKNERELLNPSKSRNIVRAHSFSTTSPDSGRAFAELIRDKRMRQAVNCFGDKIFAAQIKDFLMELIRKKLARSLLLKNTGSLKREEER